MTGQQIDRDRLRELAENATPGPWDYPGELLGLPCTTVFAGDPKRTHAAYVAEMGPQDGAFIAAARNAVPALLDENAALRARIKAVEDVLDNPIRLVDWDDPLVPATHVRRALDGEQ